MHEILRIVKIAAAKENTCKHTHTFSEREKKCNINWKKTVKYWIAIFLPEFSDPIHYFAVPFPLRIRYIVIIMLLIGFDMDVLLIKHEISLFRCAFELCVFTTKFWRRKPTKEKRKWISICTAAVLFFLSFSLSLCTWCCFCFFCCV